MANKSAAAYWKEYEDHLKVNFDDKHNFPIGVTALHHITSVAGGIPGGSIIQLLGEAGHGKSTLSMDLLANAQRSGLREININGQDINAVVLDFERSYDEDYAELFGVDNDKVFVVRTKYAEDSFNIAEAALLSGIQFFLIDSIGQLVSKEEADKDHNDPEKMAAEAKALGRFIKHANAFMDAKTLVVVINQYRANLSKMGNAPDKKGYGARVMTYASKITWELRRIKQESDRDFIELFVAKNKLGGKKGVKVAFEIVSTLGIDYPQHILDLAEEFNIIEKRGAWYYYPSYSAPEYKAQGTEKAKTQLPIKLIEEEITKFFLDRQGEDE